MTYDEATHEELRDALAAWALDACAEHEVQHVEEHLSSCEACADEARSLRAAAGCLAEVEATEPPGELRDQVLAAAFAARPPGQRRQPPAAEHRPTSEGATSTGHPFGQATDEVGSYATEVAKLDRLLITLDADEWALVTAEGWSVLELVAHLWAIDGALADTVVSDEPGRLGQPGAGVDDRTDRAQDHARRVGAERLRQLWRARADLLVATVRAEPSIAEGNVGFLGMELPATTVFADRSFETWLHAEDVRAAVGAPSQPLAPAQIHAVAAGGVSLLPMALAGLGTPAQDITVELILNGAGGGVWQVPFGPGADPARPVATIEADVMEFCLLFGGRHEPDTVPCSVRGDGTAAAALLTAAASLARP